VRRLIAGSLLALGAGALAGCHRDQIIRPEPTEEGSVGLSPSIYMGDPRSTVQLVRGFHQIEENAWRWTMGRFTLIFRRPDTPAGKRTVLVLRGNVPDSLLKKVGPVTLTALLGPDPVGQITISKPGPVTLEADVPNSLLTGETVTFDFVLDKFAPPGLLDPRELGIIVISASLESR